mgnify:CR=1 FL=1
MPLKKLKKLWWKNPKSTRYGTKWSCYKLLAHSALHSPGTETKSTIRLFILLGIKVLIHGIDLRQVIGEYAHKLLMSCILNGS